VWVNYWYSCCYPPGYFSSSWISSVTKTTTTTITTITQSPTTYRITTSTTRSPQMTDCIELHQTGACIYTTTTTKTRSPQPTIDCVVSGRIGGCSSTTSKGTPPTPTIIIVPKWGQCAGSGKYFGVCKFIFFATKFNAFPTLSYLFLKIF
jgi:hypothetical protein